DERHTGRTCSWHSAVSQSLCMGCARPIHCCPCLLLRAPTMARVSHHGGGISAPDALALSARFGVANSSLLALRARATKLAQEHSCIDPPPAVMSRDPPDSQPGVGSPLQL